MTPNTIKRKHKIVFTIAAVIAIAALYYVFDPLESVWAPKCMFRMLTGYDCPGCGSQRMLHALLHGDLQGAWEANAFLLCMLPVLLLMLYSAATRARHPRLYAVVNSVPVIIASAVALLLWMVARNL